MNPAVIAAIIGGTIAVITLIVNGRRARSDRQRELFGAVFGDVSSYCEFPYIVRRRRHDAPEEERLRITTELSEVQRKLNHNRAVLRAEAPRVARSFDTLVEATRRIAGAAIHEGWNLAPITADTSVHVTDVDLTGIKAHEDAYLTAVADHLALSPWWLRAAGRWAVRKVTSPFRRQVVPAAAPEPEAGEAAPKAQAA